MTEQQRDILQWRLDCILNAVTRAGGSGADVHRLTNMRHTGQMLKQLIKEGDSVPYPKAEAIMKRLEVDAVEFFKRKYAYMER